MQKWEYLVVKMSANAMLADAAVIDGAKYPIPNKPMMGGAELSKFLTHLGDEGWELTGRSYDFVLIFKRSKP